jgi:hypothetical protein
LKSTVDGIHGRVEPFERAWRCARSDYERAAAREAADGERGSALRARPRPRVGGCEYHPVRGVMGGCEYHPVRRDGHAAAFGCASVGGSEPGTACVSNVRSRRKVADPCHFEWRFASALGWVRVWSVGTRTISTTPGFNQRSTALYMASIHLPYATSLEEVDETLKSSGVRLRVPTRGAARRPQTRTLKPSLARVRSQEPLLHTTARCTPSTRTALSRVHRSATLRSTCLRSTSTRPATTGYEYNA